MTALGNVMALVRELQDESAAATGGTTAVDIWQGLDDPADEACASSLGEVLTFIQEMQRDSLRDFVTSLPPVPARRSVALAA